MNRKIDLILAASLAAIAALGVLSGCASTGQMATSTSNFSASTTAGVVCSIAAAAKDPLTLTSAQLAALNTGLAACGATNSGTAVNSTTVPAAIITMAAVLQQAGYRL